MAFFNGRRHFLYLRRVFLITSCLLYTNARVVTAASGLRVRLSFHVSAVPVRLTRLSANEFRFHGVTYLVWECTSVRRRTKAITPIVVRGVSVQVVR